MHFETRDQQKIYGDYSIVSVFHEFERHVINVGNHKATMLQLLSEGFKVRQLQGEWDGVKELSIEISGVGHAQAAREIAHEHNQQAYIVVGQGKATVFKAEYDSAADPREDGSERVVLCDYVASEVFHHFTTTPPITGNHSAYMNGTAFKFI